MPPTAACRMMSSPMNDRPLQRPLQWCDCHFSRSYQNRHTVLPLNDERWREWILTMFIELDLGAVEGGRWRLRDMKTRECVAHFLRISRAGLLQRLPYDPHFRVDRCGVVRGPGDLLTFAEALQEVRGIGILRNGRALRGHQVFNFLRSERLQELRRDELGAVA